MKTQSKLFRLNLLDILIGFIIAFITGTGTALYDAIQNNHLFSELDWNLIIGSGTGTAILFLLNQFTRNSNYKLLKPEQKNEGKIN
jgi:hypothetical protein